MMAPGERAKPPLAGVVAARRREMSPRMVANLLLAVGGVLVVVAAVAFTAKNWGSIPAAGRAAILLGLAALALAAAWPLARRRLTATAETAAAIGLALTAVGAYLARPLAGAVPGGGLGLAAATTAVLAACWAVYGGFAPVRVPRLAAIVLAQAPIPLAAAAVSPAPALIALALLVTAGGDLVAAWWAGRGGRGGERLACLGVAGAAWLGAAVSALAGMLAGPGSGELFLLSGVLLLAAVVGVLGARVGRDAGSPLGTAAAGVTAVSGALAAVGLAVPAASLLPAAWAAAAFAAAGAGIAAAGWWWAKRETGAARPAGSGEDRPEPWRPAGSAGQIGDGAAAVLVGAGLWVVPVASSALWLPLARLGQVWTGWPAFHQAALGAVAAWPSSLVTPAAPAVLALVSIACWCAPAVARRRSGLRAAAVAAAALAGASVPVAAGLALWAGLAVLTVLTGALLASASGSVLPARMLAGTASVAGLVAATSAALWSLATPGSTMAELAALTVICGVAAAMTRSALPAALATAGAVAAAAGLACAVPYAAGIPAAAGFAVLGVAVIAVGASALLRRARPGQAFLLDLAAVPVVLLALLLSAPRTDLFSVLAAAAGLLAAGAAWAQSGPRRAAALVAAVIGAVAAIVPQVGIIGRAVYLAVPPLVPPWQGMPPVRSAGLGLAGLPLALAVLAGCAAAMVVAAGAWRGRQGSLDAVAVALPVVAAPVAAAGGLSYGIAVGLMLALTLALTVWAAASRGLAPAAAALVAAAITVAWAMAAPAPTLIVLGCLSVTYPLCAWRARIAGVRIASAVASVACVSALAGCSGLAAGLPGWLAGLAMLSAAAAAQLAAGLLRSADPRAPGSSREPGSPLDLRDSTDQLSGPGPLSGSAVLLAAELTGWLAALVAVAPSLGQPDHASTALAALALLCLGVAVRPDRRFLLWVGLVLADTALCVWLASHGVNAPEPYTAPAAAIVTGFGWQRSRRSPAISSWLTYGPGLALLLIPSLAAAWQDHGWVRPLLLGLAATGVTLLGARSRLQAPALLGAAVVLLDAGRQLAPAIVRLAGALPRWVPIAAIGLVLLLVGATFEARLRDLRRLRAVLGRMH